MICDYIFRHELTSIMGIIFIQIKQSAHTNDEKYTFAGREK